MDKCIKVELPTGHVLLEKSNCEQRGDHYLVIDERGADNLSDVISFGEFSVFNYRVSGWVYVEQYHNGCVTNYGPFKVIAQYGDEFPV